MKEKMPLPTASHVPEVNFTLTLAMGQYHPLHLRATGVCVYRADQHLLAEAAASLSLMVQPILQSTWTSSHEPGSEACLPIHIKMKDCLHTKVHGAINRRPCQPQRDNNARQMSKQAEQVAQVIC